MVCQPPPIVAIFWNRCRRQRHLQHRLSTVEEVRAQSKGSGLERSRKALRYLPMGIGVQPFKRIGWTVEGGDESEDRSLTHKCYVCGQTKPVSKFPTKSNTEWRFDICRHPCDDDAVALKTELRCTRPEAIERLRSRYLMEPLAVDGLGNDKLTSSELTAAPTGIGPTKQTSEQLATRSAEAKGVPGVYVYSLPHYLAHHVDSDTRRTLFKVGHSSVDAFGRANAQGRFTALPEDPILLRIYPCDQSAKAEAEFHGRLSQAGHLRPGPTTRAGIEWFLTKIDFLDNIANELGLEIQPIVDPGAYRQGEA